MKEVWKDIENYEGLYKISNLGRVRTVERYTMVTKNNTTFKKILRSKIRSQMYNKYGYKRMILIKNKSYKNVVIHRLVALAFIPNPQNKKTVNHIDGNKSNNRVDNLEWATHSENRNHYLDEIRKDRYNHKFNKRVYCVELDKYFISGSECARYFNVNPSNIIRVCNGKRKTYKGMKFIYVE